MPDGSYALEYLDAVDVAFDGNRVTNVNIYFQNIDLSIPSYQPLMENMLTDVEGLSITVGKVNDWYRPYIQWLNQSQGILYIYFLFKKNIVFAKKTQQTQQTQQNTTNQNGEIAFTHTHIMLSVFCFLEAAFFFWKQKKIQNTT